MRRLLGDTLVYGIGSSLTRFCGLLLFPVYAKLLSTDDYAGQDLALTLATLVQLMVGLGLDQGYARIYYERDESGRRNLAATWGVAILCTTLVAMPVLLALRYVIADLAAIRIDGAGELLLWAFGGAGLQLALRQPMLTLRLRKQSVRFVLVSLATALGQLAFGLWLVKYKMLGAVGAGMAYAGGSLAGLLASMIAVGWMWSGSWCWRDLREMLAFGVPLLPAAAAAWFLEAVNRFILQHFSVPLQTAVFGVSVRIASILGLVLYGFQMAWGPYAYELMTRPKEAASAYVRAARWLWWVGGSGAVVLSLFAPELIAGLTKEEYVDADEVVPWLCLSYLVSTFFSIAVIGYLYGKRTQHQIIVLGAGCLVVAVLGPSVAAAFGAIGIGIVSLLAYWVASMLAARASRKYLDVRFPWIWIMLWQLVILLSSVALPRLLPTAEVLAIAAFWPVALKLLIGAVVMCVGMLIMLAESDIRMIIHSLDRLWFRSPKR